MPDKTVPFYSVVMVRGEPITVHFPLPTGYFFVFFSPGMEEDWCRIQCSVKSFPNMSSARCAFDTEFAPYPELLQKRMIFVCDSAQRAVATGCLWQGNDLGRRMDRVHWVATIPGLQKRGIGKALVAKLMEVCRTEGMANGVYLTTQTTSYRAINIYQKFGFEPYCGPRPRNFRTQGGSYEEETKYVWQIIHEKLAAYNGCISGNDSSSQFPSSTSHALFFKHETMFSKCSICKVFEITAPSQSGDVLHSHDYSQIWYVTRGSCEHFVEGQKHEMFVGDAFLLPPRVVHSTIVREGGSIICCEFYMEGLFPDNANSFDRVRQITQNISFTMLFQQELYSTQPKFTLSREGQRRVEKLMHSMLEEYTQAEEFFTDYLHLQILELLLTFAREYSQSPAHEVSEKVYDKYRSMVENAIHFIDQHYNEPLTLDGVCKISMVSKTYFCYLFKLLTHQTFIEYLMDRRINKAMELLRQTDMSVIDIGQTVGFRDSTHFSRTFKRLKGISPREYRSAAKRH